MNDYGKQLVVMTMFETILKRQKEIVQLMQEITGNESKAISETEKEKCREYVRERLQMI